MVDGWSEADLTKQQNEESKTTLEVAPGAGHPETAALLEQADEANTAGVEPEPEGRMEQRVPEAGQSQCVDRGHAESSVTNRSR